MNEKTSSIDFNMIDLEIGKIFLKLEFLKRLNIWKLENTPYSYNEETGQIETTKKFSLRIGKGVGISVQYK